MPAMFPPRFDHPWAIVLADGTRLWMPGDEQALRVARNLAWLIGPPWPDDEDAPAI